MNPATTYDLNSGELKSKLDVAARLAAKVYNVPVALVNVVEPEDVTFRGIYGLDGVTSVRREHSLCSDASRCSQLTVYEDTHAHEELSGNPLVHGDFGMRFYAGYPVTTPDGQPLGTFCILDYKPRIFSRDQLTWLEDFARIVMAYFESHRLSA